MLHFFRKIRRDLIANSQTYKYLKYAIGEVILVMLGILMALYINNWNEERKNKQKLTSIFIEIQDDLSKDILRLDEILPYHKEKDSLMYLVLKDSLTIEDYGGNKDLQYLISYYEVFDVHDNGFTNLMNNMDYIESSHKPLVDKLKDLYVEKKNKIEKYNEKIGSTASRNVRELAESKKWAYKQDYGLTAEMKEYFLNDPFYKNRVYIFQMHLYNFDYLEYRNNASLIYSELSELMGRQMELPIHLINSIHDPDSLKNYIGTYKPLDTLISYNYEIITDKHDIYLKAFGEKIEIFQIARDTFGMSAYPNLFHNFKRDKNGKIVGVKTVFHTRIREFQKIE